MRFRYLLPLSVMLLIGALPALAGLQIGDPAPPLSVTHWVKGGPIDIRNGAGKQVYVLEFWATWCFPCIQAIPEVSALQKRYRDRGVTVVAVTSAGGGPQRQSLDKVKSFVDKQGAAMDYAVAFDETNRVDQDYLQALGAMGIPHTVVVDKTGKVAWSGHPAEGIEDVLEEILADDYDADQANRRRRADAILQRASPFLQQGLWTEGLAAIDEALQVDPAHEMALRYTVEIYLSGLTDREGLRKWAAGYINKHPQDVAALATLAQALMAIGNLEDRQPELVLRAARTAYDAGKQTDPLAIETYAQAVFAIGQLDEAIRLQTDCLRLAPESDKVRQQAVLDFYVTCKKLQTGSS